MALRDKELLVITQELTLLRANLLKEQSKLRQVVCEQSKLLKQQDQELKELRRQNQTLLLASSKAKLMMDDCDMDTPSSEESSPKSSFSKVPKPDGIKTRQLFTKLESDTVKKNHSDEHINRVSDPPRLLPKSTEPVKPPVPSRAGVNRKLLIKQQHNTNVSKDPQLETSDQSSTITPPVPSARSTSLNASVLKEDRFDSGRESDADGSLCLGSNSSLASPVSRSVSTRSDDGFSSSHEDSPSLISSGKGAGPSSQIRQLTNHRAVQKPSDIKFRSKLRSSTIPPSPSSGLSVLEEHKVVTSSGCDPISDGTTVTYWTEPYV